MNMRFVALVLIALGLASCHFNCSYIDRAEDIEEGKIVVGKFYNDVMDNNYRDIFTLFNNNFYNVTSREQLETLLEQIKARLGSFQSYKIIKARSESIVGTDAKTGYFYTCRTLYSRSTTEEYFTVEKIDGIIKITGYKVNVINRKSEK